jgi:hypothetical protein
MTADEGQEARDQDIRERGMALTREAAEYAQYLREQFPADPERLSNYDR